jgi:hypothetical protein
MLHNQLSGRLLSHRPLSAYIFQALVLGSVFFQMKPDTDAFFSRAGALF